MIDRAGITTAARSKTARFIALTNWLERNIWPGGQIRLSLIICQKGVTTIYMSSISKMRLVYCSESGGRAKGGGCDLLRIFSGVTTNVTNYGVELILNPDFWKIPFATHSDGFLCTKFPPRNKLMSNVWKEGVAFSEIKLELI